MDFLKIIDMYGNEKLAKGSKTPSKSIHEYSKSNDKENIVLLLKDVDNKEKYLQSKDEYGATALHYAAKNGFNDLVIYLSSENNNNFSDIDNSGFTALHCAAGFGHKEVVNTILKGIENDLNLINIKDNSGSTALHYACHYDHIPVALILVDNGASPEIKNNNEKSCFDLVKDWISRESLEHHAALYVERQRTQAPINNTNNNNLNTIIDNDNKPNTRDITNDEPLAKKYITIEVYVAIILAIVSYFLLK